jgi:hypothetical protein
MNIVYHAQSMVIRLLTWLYDLLQLGAVFDALLQVVMRVTELDVVPDFIIRRGIRLLLKIRLLSVSADDRVLAVVALATGSSECVVTGESLCCCKAFRGILAPHKVFNTNTLVYQQ